MKLIVGLGNPGNEYRNTRHNIGFMAIDKCLEKYSISEKKRFDGLSYEILIGNEKIIFLKPQKYMNLSGDVVKKYVDFYKINIDDILIISDDLDMPCGKIKIKLTGSSGGHNGLKNIENNLGTKNYKRIKVGIANNKFMDTKDYVLGVFSTEEKQEILKALDVVSNIVEDYLKISFENLMNKYN